MIFLQSLVWMFPVKIHKVQTHNGPEFTKRFTGTDEPTQKSHYSTLPYFLIGQTALTP